MSQLQKNLQYLIDKRQTNPNALSVETGVPQPTIHRILNGTSGDPRTNTLKPLADYFGFTVEALRTLDIETADAMTNNTLGAGPSHPVVLDAPGVYRIDFGRSEGAPTSEPTLSSFENDVIAKLPEGINATTGATVRYGASIFELDYLTDNVCADFKIAKGISADAIIERAIYRLSTIQQIHKAHGNARKLYVVIAVSPGPMLQRQLNRLVPIGALHGVEVFQVSDAAQCASLLATLEHDVS